MQCIGQWWIVNRHQWTALRRVCVLLICLDCFVYFLTLLDSLEFSKSNISLLSFSIWRWENIIIKAKKEKTVARTQPTRLTTEVEEEQEPTLVDQWHLSNGSLGWSRTRERNGRCHMSICVCCMLEVDKYFSSADSEKIRFSRVE
jgi:hypothetical protein